LWREAVGDGLTDRSDQAYLSEPSRTKDQDISKVGLKGEKDRKSGLSSSDHETHKTVHRYFFKRILLSPPPQL